MTLRAVCVHGTVVIDGWLVSSLGEVALAAMGLAAALGGMALGVVFAFSHAMQIRSAQAYGSGDPVHRKSALFGGMIINVGVGVCGLAFVYAAGWPLINALAADESIAANAKAYLALFAGVIVFESIGQCLASYFNGCGRTKLPLYAFCLSLPINIVASVALIHGLWGLPALGVAGAALGSAIATGVQAAFFCICLIRSDKPILKLRGWRHHTAFNTAKRHAAFALPIATTFVSASLATHVCTLLYANMALADFAALTLIAPWNMVVGQLSMQWTQATGILVAQLLGQRTATAVLDRFLSSAWRGAFVTAAVVSGVFCLLWVSVDSVYAELAPETRATLTGFLPIVILAAFPRATNAICGNILRASGDTVYVMNLFLWSQWLFRVPAVAIAVLVLELSAVWVVAILLAEEALKFLPFHRRLWRGDWKRARVGD